MIYRVAYTVTVGMVIVLIIKKNTLVGRQLMEWGEIAEYAQW